MMGPDSSILTNAGQKTALQLFNQNSDRLAETRKMISTGKKVENAKDGPASFVTAKKIDGDVGVYRQMSENLGLSRQTLRVAGSAIEDVANKIGDLKELVTGGANAARGGEEIQQEFAEIVGSIRDRVEGAQFNGRNVLTDRSPFKTLTGMSREDGQVQSNKAELEPLSVTDRVVERLEGMNPGTSPDTMGLNIQNDIESQLSGAGVSTDRTNEVKQAIQKGFDQWDQLISNDQYAEIDVEVQIASIDGAGGTLAQAKAETYADLSGDGVSKGSVQHKIQGNGDINGATRDALIKIDADDFGLLSFGDDGSGQFRAKDILAHEFGHAFGIADGVTNTWTENVSTVAGDDVFTGENASKVNAGQSIALDNGSPHLDEDVYGDALMTPTVSPDEGNLEMSSVLGPILQDMGYDASSTGQGSLKMLEDAQQAALDAAAKIGSMRQNLEGQEEMVGQLADKLDTGVGELVDANMAEAAAKLQAQQAQQDLVSRSLSIANRKPQSLVSLFG